MDATKILTQINQLPLVEKIHIVELVLKTIRRDAEQKQSLKEGAQVLLADYEEDGELTAFIELDSQDFYETK